MKITLAIILFTSFLVSSQTRRVKRLFSLFNVVKFTNDPCEATDLKNGTCYTSQECSQRFGTNSGSCAGGFGVCCTFSLGCGGKSIENNTYFQSSSNKPGECSIEVCPCKANICKLRLDFSTFVIAGPSTETDTIALILNGAQAPSTSASVSRMSQCYADQFYVTNPGGPSPPVICGINSGIHIFVDASPGCNKIGFNIGEDTAVRQWDIQIRQISCQSDNLPPEGCTQYHYGSTRGIIKSFNFDGNLHLANQNQNICIRKERGMCRICYSTEPNAFDISSNSNINIGSIGLQSKCCGYGSDGRQTKGYDCIIIPIATKKSSTGKLIPSNADEFCGRALASVMNGPPATICSMQHPFQVRFLSDNYEFANEAKLNPDGFRINYELLPCSF